MAIAKRSLRAQVLNWLMILFGILLGASCAISYLAASDFANLPYDGKLMATAQALGRQVESGPAGPRFDMPASVREALMQDEVDRLLFRITDAQGDLIAGTPLLPPAVDEFDQPIAQFQTTEIDGLPMRLATVQTAVSDAPGTYVVVQVAETMLKRTILAREIFVKLLVPQIILAALPIAALWLKVGSGLAPLERLRSALTTRPQSDLSPVEIEDETPDEVRPLIEAFNEILGRMRRLLEAQKRFVADAAHQLRTPLAGVKTQAELAQRLDDPEAIRSTLRHVLAGAERGSKLVNQLLSLARHEEGGRETVPLQQLDLNDVVQAAATIYVDAALSKRIDLGCEQSDRPVLVTGEPISLREMVGNLIDNAIRYTPEGGRVTARVHESEGTAHVVVEDNGPGIQAGDRQRIFERFYRGLGTGQEGSGLGLAIVTEIADVHGGSVQVGDGTDGGGAVFTIRLPIARNLPGPESYSGPSADAPTPPGSAPGNSPDRALSES